MNLAEKFLDTYRTFNGDAEVFENPSKSEMPKSGRYRILFDIDKAKLFAWRYDDAIHNDIFNRLINDKKIKESDNIAEIVTEHGNQLVVAFKHHIQKIKEQKELFLRFFNGPFKVSYWFDDAKTQEVS